MRILPKRTPRPLTIGVRQTGVLPDRVSGTYTLWNVHKVHHSSRSLDGLATTRTHIMEHGPRPLPE